MSLALALVLIIQIPAALMVAWIAWERRKLRETLDEFQRQGRANESHPDYWQWLALYRKWWIEPPKPHGKRELKPV